MGFFSKKKNILILLCIVLICVASVFVSIISKSNGGIINDAVNTIVSPIQYGISTCVNGVRGFFSFINDSKGYRTENELLKRQINELTTEYKTIEEYKEENERLKGLLNLKEELIEFDTIGARVISKDSTNWYDVFTIDKGIMNGLKIDDVIMTAQGLAGRVSEVGLNWAKISSIINEHSSVGGYVERIGEVAVVEGNILLSRDGLCSLTHLPVESALSIGDIVKTSGLSDIYPRGIIIGKVTKIFTDVSTSSKSAVIEPVVDFSNIIEVLVIRNDTLKE